MTAHRKHNLTPDPDIPPDHRGRERCTTCRLMGARGDLHHFKTDQDLDADADAEPQPRPRRRNGRDDEYAEQARRREAAILGEKEDDE